MWNDDWRMELEQNNEPCFTRLCECRNTKNDMLIMGKLIYKYNQNKDAEECLDRICEWVCCWNNQWNMELTNSEYKIFLEKIKKSLL